MRFQTVKRGKIGKIRSITKKGHQKFSALKWKFYPEKVILKFGPRHFFRPLKLSDKSPPMRIQCFFSGNALKAVPTHFLLGLSLLGTMYTCLVHFVIMRSRTSNSFPGKALCVSSGRHSIRLNYHCERVFIVAYK